MNSNCGRSPIIINHFLLSILNINLKNLRFNHPSAPIALIFRSNRHPSYAHGCLACFKVFSTGDSTAFRGHRGVMSPVEPTTSRSNCPIDHHQLLNRHKLT